MAPNTTLCRPGAPRCGRRTLQRLRREAGYRSAKEFAKLVGIPASTYARYERAGDGKGCGIPISSAWAIADALCCSIDLVVGREDIDAPEDHTIQSRYDALNPTTRELVESYLSYCEASERASSSVREGRQSI